MNSLSSICFQTETGDQILLSANGLQIDPLRVLVMTEVDYLQMIETGGKVSENSQMMPVLSSDVPTVKLSMPSAGHWRIVYYTSDADSMTVSVVRRD